MGEATVNRRTPEQHERATAIALLVNPEAGRGEAEHVRLELEALGGAVEVYPLSEWRRAARSNADRIVVAGGDGSVGSAAAAASAAAVPLGVIPAGTANDFARALGLPDEPPTACRLAVNGVRTRSLDLGRMGDRPFVNVASVGLPPVAASAARNWKRPLGSLAYALGAARAGLTAKPVGCTLRCDGAPVFSGRAWQVTVACTGAFGAGSQVVANPSDGLLDVVVVCATPRLTLALRAYGLRRGGLASQRGVRSFRARRVELQVPERTAYNVDGELVETGAAVFGAVAGAFEVIVG
jgi:diacylglycerol kinase (ATP)